MNNLGLEPIENKTGPIERPFLVYLAGPISSNPLKHLADALCFAKMLIIACGGRVIPLIPQLTIFWQAQDKDMDYESFMEIDFRLILAADAVFRLVGDSKGADREVLFARKHNKPIFWSSKMLMNAIETGELRHA